MDLALFRRLHRAHRDFQEILPARSRGRLPVQQPSAVALQLWLPLASTRLFSSPGDAQITCGARCLRNRSSKSRAMKLIVPLAILALLLPAAPFARSAPSYDDDAKFLAGLPVRDP